MIITAMGGYEQYLVTAGYDNMAILWDLDTLKQVSSCDLPDCPHAVVGSPDGSFYVVGTGGYVYKLKVV